MVLGPRTRGFVQFRYREQGGVDRKRPAGAGQGNRAEMAPGVGVEPTTYGLTVRRSAD